MIIKEFDNGWGKDFPLKQFEQQIQHQMLTNVRTDQSRTVVINSVWYTQDFHEQVMSWLRDNQFDHIVLVAMLDAAIPYPDRYQEFGCTVSAMGYYPGTYHLDFCALFVDRFLRPPDTTWLMDHSSIDTPFMCLNRKPHWHRVRLYQALQSLDLVDRGLVSMGSQDGPALRTLAQDRAHDDLAPNATADHYGIPNDIVSLGHLANWQKCLLNVVTETFFDINKTGFVSEKIYKPIVGCRPFLVYDPDGATTWLHDRGFESFVQDFQDISDLDLRRPNNLAPFLSELSAQPVTYYRKKFIDLREKILYNKQHFRSHIQRQQQTMQRGISCPI
jgi:hypothetical protein